MTGETLFRNTLQSKVWQIQRLVEDLELEITDQPLVLTESALEMRHLKSTLSAYEDVLHLFEICASPNPDLQRLYAAPAANDGKPTS